MPVDHNQSPCLPQSVETLIQRCREIAETPLDDPDVRLKMDAYFREAGVKNYDKSWRRWLAELIDIIGSGEIELSRVIALFNGRSLGKRFEHRPFAYYVALNRVIEMPTPTCLRLHKGAVVDQVIAACRPETAAVIELGSGWGEHLFNVWREGGPRDATYYACELTESGRQATEVLATLEDKIDIKTLSFNYVSPDFSSIPDTYEDIVVFTSHSIEQVRSISEQTIPLILRHGKRVRGVHLEPIGWQMVETQETSCLSEAHRRRSEDMNYNKDFWAQLRDLEKAGSIEIERRVPYFVGLDYNPASLVVWRKR